MGEIMSQPRPWLLSLAKGIWTPRKAKPQEHALVVALETQVLAENWPGALACAQRLNVTDQRSNDFWYWQLARLELFLLVGRPEKTHPELDRILAAHPKPSSSSSTRSNACELKARAFAEQGDYPKALLWNQRAQDAYWSRCGNCFAGKEMGNAPLSTVWKAAALPDEKALTTLLQIRQGQFALYKHRLLLQPPERSARWQRDEARDEAGLALGNLYQRRGSFPEARRALEPVAQCKDDLLALLARTHLRQLPPVSKFPVSG